MHLNTSRLLGGAAFAAAAFMAVPAFAAPDLIVNGGFEDPAIPFGSYALFNNIPGWTAYEDAFGPLFLGSFPGPIEVQNNVAGAPAFGAQFIELDSTSSSFVYQFIPTTPGTQYTLTFYYSKRPNVADNSFGYGIGIGLPTDDVTLVPLSGVVGATNFVKETHTFTGTGFDAIYFFNNNPSDGLGSYIDNVSVTAVPEPGAVATGIVLFGGAGLGLLRGRRRNKKA